MIMDMQKKSVHTLVKHIYLLHTRTFIIKKIQMYYKHYSKLTACTTNGAEILPMFSNTEDIPIAWFLQTRKQHLLTKKFLKISNN